MFRSCYARPSVWEIIPKRTEGEAAVRPPRLPVSMLLHVMLHPPTSVGGISSGAGCFKYASNQRMARSM